MPSRVEAEGGNVQVICREERYAYFDTVMKQENFDKLVLGHHADDQIETIVMSLVRGTVGIFSYRNTDNKTFFKR